MRLPTQLVRLGLNRVRPGDLARALGARFKAWVIWKRNMRAIKRRWRGVPELTPPEKRLILVLEALQSSQIFPSSDVADIAEMVSQNFVRVSGIEISKTRGYLIAEEVWQRLRLLICLALPAALLLWDPGTATDTDHAVAASTAVVSELLILSLFSGYPWTNGRRWTRVLSRVSVAVAVAIMLRSIDKVRFAPYETTWSPVSPRLMITDQAVRSGLRVTAIMTIALAGSYVLIATSTSIVDLIARTQSEIFGFEKYVVIELIDILLALETRGGTERTWLDENPGKWGSRLYSLRVANALDSLAREVDSVWVKRRQFYGNDDFDQWVRQQSSAIASTLRSWRPLAFQGKEFSTLRRMLARVIIRLSHGDWSALTESSGREQSAIGRRSLSHIAKRAFVPAILFGCAILLIANRIRLDPAFRTPLIYLGILFPLLELAAWLDPESKDKISAATGITGIFRRPPS